MDNKESNVISHKPEDLRIKFFSEKLQYNADFALNLDTRTIYLFGMLTEEIGTNLRVKYNIIKAWWNTVEQKEFNDITIDISTGGGSIYSIPGALDFYDELKAEGVLVNTKAQTICMSAATILLAGGTGERTATKRCRFMLHDIQVDGMGGTTRQLQSAMKNLNEEQMELFTYYAQFARKGQKQLEGNALKKEALAWIKKYTSDATDHYISAEEILKLKLIDRVY